MPTFLQGTKVNSRGKEMPHGTRLYSIAASRYGDKFDGKTTTLCVRRATYWDPEKVALRARCAQRHRALSLCAETLCTAM